MPLGCKLGLSEHDERDLGDPVPLSTQCTTSYLEA